MVSAMDTLVERGFVQDVSDAEGLRDAFERRVTFYTGFDPTASSLHVGHLLGIMTMRLLQRHGHRPIALVGGGTARIGDPSGKTASRPMLSGEEIDSNGLCFRAQLARYLDLGPGQGLLLDNKEWLLGLELIPFLREIGKHFSINHMLAAEVYKNRLETGLTFLEFNYMLLQSYDFLHLHGAEDCVLFVGGSDQWSNSLAGIDLIRKVKEARAYTLVTPLLTTATGQKMGKTESGAVWLDADLTSPFDFYQYWINTDDRDVERFLAYFTDLPMDEVRRLGSLEGAEIRKAKEVLAFETTRLSHGQLAAEQARDASRALFSGHDASAAPTVPIPAAEVVGLTVADIFIRAGLCESRNAVRRLVDQGGATIDGQKVTSIDAPVDPDALRAGLLLRSGKKRYALVKVGE